MATAGGFSLLVKKKHFKFSVKLEVEELSSVPFVSGILFAKIRLLNGGSFTDFTNRIEISENRVLWQKHFHFVCKASANIATGVLEPCMFRVSVRKEMKGGRAYQKLGYVDINLSQFAGAGRTSHRYVLDGYNSKNRQDNSTLKIVLDMTLLSGDPCFKVPMQNQLQPILINDNCEGSALHLGNKGGASGDGTGDVVQGSLTLSVNMNPAISSQSSLDQESQRSLKVSESVRPGHVRHASDQSKASAGYVSASPVVKHTHTRQASADALLYSHHHRYVSDGSTDSAVYSGSIPRTPKRLETVPVLNGERRLNLTRVDPNELVDELISGIDFNDITAAEGGAESDTYTQCHSPIGLKMMTLRHLANVIVEYVDHSTKSYGEVSEFTVKTKKVVRLRGKCSGLQLFVAKDGTAVLGSSREAQPPSSFKVLPVRPTLPT